MRKSVIAEKDLWRIRNCQFDIGEFAIFVFFELKMNITGKIVVTGASGFLGGRVAAFFAENHPDAEIVATSRSNAKKSTLVLKGCEYKSGDLTNFSFCKDLTEGASVVIHCAALSSPYGKFNDFYQSNIVATKCLLEASKANKVQRFIYISTPSIYVNFTDRFDVKESDPLPEKSVNHYAATKLGAEKFVLSQNSSSFSTLALRPRAIIGAEDTVIFPRVFEAYKKGKLKIVGTGTNRCDLTCARNVIEAILCAIKAPKSSYGEAYNITNGEAVDFWSTLNYALTSLNYQAISKKVSKNIAMKAASVVEGFYKIFYPSKEPAMTKYGIAILADNFTLNIDKAKEKLKYNPVQNTREGIDEFIEWYKKTNK